MSSCGWLSVSRVISALIGLSLMKSVQEFLENKNKEFSKFNFVNHELGVSCLRLEWNNFKQIPKG